MKTDVYSLVTDRILSMLEEGQIPWQKPWSGTFDGAISRSTGKPYSLLNQMLLGKEGEYLTFKEVQRLGGKIKKGSKGNMVVFFKQVAITESEKNEDGEMVEKKKNIPLLRYYYVYHIDDCEGIEPKYNKEEVKSNLSPVKEAEKVLEDYYGRESVKLFVEKSDRAYYSPSNDEVHIPLMEQYKIVEEYYSTAFHETAHSTGHESRLKREFGSFFGSDQYSKEELVAEMSAAYLCNYCGLDNEKAFRNSVGYIQSWSKALRSDKKLIVSAASKAEKAVKYILTGSADPSK